NNVLKAGQEAPLGVCRHVQPMHQAVRLEVLEQGLLQDRVVVAVVQRSRTSQKIDVLTALLVEQRRPAGLREYGRKRPTVTANVGFEAIENVHDVVIRSSPALKGPIRSKISSSC